MLNSFNYTVKTCLVWIMIT